MTKRVQTGVSLQFGGRKLAQVGHGLQVPNDDARFHVGTSVFAYAEISLSSNVGQFEIPQRSTSRCDIVLGHCMTPKRRVTWQATSDDESS
jgi:hypothetical protein